MKIFVELFKYLGLMAGLAVVPAAYLGFVVATSDKNPFGIGLLISIVAAAVLAAISLLIRPVEDSDEVTGYTGTSVGNSVNLRPATRGDDAWKWRTFLIWLLIVSGAFLLSNLFAR